MKMNKTDRIVRDAWTHCDCVTLCEKSRIVFDGVMCFLEVEHVEDESLYWLRIARRLPKLCTTEISLPQRSPNIVLMKIRLQALLRTKIFSNSKQQHFIYSERIIPSLWHRLVTKEVLIPEPIKPEETISRVIRYPIGVGSPDEPVSR